MSFHIQKVKGQLRSYFIMFLWLIKVNMSSMGFSSKQLQMIFVALRQVFQRIVLCLSYCQRREICHQVNTAYLPWDLQTFTVRCNPLNPPLCLFFLLFINCCDVNTLSKYVMNKIPHSFSHYLLVPFLFTTQGAWFWPKQHCSLWNELSVLYWWLEEELSNVKNSDKQPTVAL